MKNNTVNKNILLGLTTTKKSNWREKISEIDKFGIKEISLFPTSLNLEERKELYGLLEKTALESIPHVHLRDDMEKWEFDFLIDEYKTQVFNFHAVAWGVNLLKYTEYLNKMYVENFVEIDDVFLDCVKKCAGACLDVSHWQDHGSIQKNNGYENFKNILKEHKVGCCHISAVRDEFTIAPYWITGGDIKSYSQHYLNNLHELDYVGEYIQYLPDIISIELENSFEEQIKAKEYLEEIINK